MAKLDLDDTSEWHWAVSTLVIARHLQEPGTHPHASLVVVAHHSALSTTSLYALAVLSHTFVVPFRSGNYTNVVPFLCQGICIHFHQLYKPSFGESKA